MTSRTPRIAAAACLAALLLTTAACTTPPGRSGVTEPRVAMRSAYGNGAPSVGADALRALLEDSTSPAQLTDITDEILPGETDDSDGDTIAALRAGDVDIAVVRSGRLALEGATSMLALQAPMVVTNDEQAARAAADPTVLAALDGLEEIGLVGLALVPGGVRHPFGYGTALDDPADFAGKVINTRADANATAIVEALGGSVDHSVGETRTKGSKDGTLRGVETSFGQQGAVDPPAVVVSNLVLYSKFDVVVIRQQAYDSLSANQQRALRERATEDAATAVAARPDEAAGLKTWCTVTGATSIVVPAAIAAFHERLDPVVDALQEDPDAAKVIDRLRALHSGTVDPSGRACTGPEPGADDQYSMEPTGSQRVLDGTWRIDVAPEPMLAAGATEQFAYANAGIWTLRIRNGVAETDQPSGEPCTLTFTFSGDEVLVEWGDTGCNGAMRGTYAIHGDTVDFRWTAERDYDVALDQAAFGSMTRVTG